MSRFTIYRDIVLLHLGVTLALYEQLATPPPFDLTVAGLVAAVLGVPLTQAIDRTRVARRESGT